MTVDWTMVRACQALLFTANTCLLFAVNETLSDCVLGNFFVCGLGHLRTTVLDQRLRSLAC